MSDLKPRSHNPDALRAPTVDGEGKRRWIYPERRKGKRAKKRKVLALILMAVYLISPFVTIMGLPFLRFDVMSSIIYVFGQTFRFSDGFYLAFVALAAGLLLAWATSLWGRIWCGYACPQTVFVEWLIRPIEEFFEGPALRRRKNDSLPMTPELLLRKVGKHLTFSIVLMVISNAFIAYFIDPSLLWGWIKGSPLEHPQAFFLMSLVFGALYFDLVWFREQFCAFLCPYGRFQSVMIDSSTPTVAYDYNRGEPRGKKSLGIKGDCIDCGLCVRVCPTGIDIRNGLQLECIQCMRCTDACDDVMTGIKRPKGLIRLAAETELKGEPKAKLRRLRPAIYLGLFLVNITVLGFAVASRDSLKLTVMRQPSSTYVEVAPNKVANYFVIRAVNQGHTSEQLEFDVEDGVQIICSLCGQSLPQNKEFNGNLVVFFDPAKVDHKTTLKVKGSERKIELPLLQR